MQANGLHERSKFEEENVCVCKKISQKNSETVDYVTSNAGMGKKKKKKKKKSLLRKVKKERQEKQSSENKQENRFLAETYEKEEEEEEEKSVEKRDKGRARKKMTLTPQALTTLVKRANTPQALLKIVLEARKHTKVDYINISASL
ncbi:hypothetical protein RFI_18104, partial [Reticulomyxa filosa]